MYRLWLLLSPHVPTVRNALTVVRLSTLVNSCLRLRLGLKLWMQLMLFDESCRSLTILRSAKAPARVIVSLLLIVVMLGLVLVLLLVHHYSLLGWGTY